MTKMASVDWMILISYFVVSLMVGLTVSKKAGKNSTEYFLGGRAMPWWLLGISMVATTFSTDTPNLVTDIVRTSGVAGNWAWWAFLLSGMLTVFIYARLWRRSGVMTDVEFYEIRYSGKPAAFLRGFRALYLGVFFNIMIMATVSLAAIKIGGVLMGLSPVHTILIALAVTVAYSTLGGLRAVLITDFILFAFAMFGAVAAAVVACRHPEVGGLSGLFHHPNVADKLSLIPALRGESWAADFVPLFLIPIAVQWWSVWYPGSEPGGGGYQAQRMLSARNEEQALSATLLFNICHYALRPWPWILVALASLVVFPDLAAIQDRFPGVDPGIIKHDIAYPAMLTFLPAGLMGLVVASLLAAYMSTMSTHLNWGASYVVNDFYKRFLKPQATEKELVCTGRIATVLLTAMAGGGALMLSNALQAFHILLQIGAGTGLIFILRWFWWRINAWTEIAGMTISFIVALYFEVIHGNLGLEPWPTHLRLVTGVGITTVGWVLVTFLTRPVDMDILQRFYRRVMPGGRGWNPVLEAARRMGDPISETALAGELPRGIVCMVMGSFAVYGTIFAVGYVLYGRWIPFVIATACAITGFGILCAVWRGRGRGH